MIPPREQWAVQIDVTNACIRRCSNCTRMTGHRPTWHMECGVFQQALEALRDFPTSAHRPGDARQKVIGMIGGEPLLHPDFAELCRIFRTVIPNPAERGLWSGIAIRDMAPLHRNAVLATFPAPAYVNDNNHSGQVYHHPVLVAARDAIPDEDAMWKAIMACELQERWASNVTPKGFFFCEVAGCLDMTFDGPGGLPVDRHVWTLPLSAFREQIERWCPRCGICVRSLSKRRDGEERDDISQTNLAELQRLGSRRVERGRFILWNPAQPAGAFAGDSPLSYLKGK